jgi:hypothetical protein
VDYRQETTVCFQSSNLSNMLAGEYAHFVPTPSEAMGFTEWPQELIFQVLNDAAVGLHEKCNLARVNHRMHQLVLPLLYQSIQINIPEPKTGDGRKDAFRSFKNALSENADLPSLIQKLDVSWHCVQHGLAEPYPEDHVVIEPDIGRGINKLLDLVPKIQTLVLQRVSRRRQGRTYLPPDDWGGIYECPFLYGPQLNNLRELRLLGLSIGINTIALIMRLPKLKVLEVQRLAQNSEPIEEKHLSIRSTVKELHLGPYCKPHADMELLFQWSGGLETLSYDLGVYLGRRQPPDPSTLSRLLAPHTNTLVDIKLSGADNSVIHMDSINFRPFSKLKKLVIANKLLFPCHFGTHEEQAPYRNGVYKRLPPSLEHFEVQNHRPEREFLLLIK